MAQIPETKDLRVVNPPLTDYASALIQDRTEYMADRTLERKPTERTGQVWLKSTLDGMSDDDDIDIERLPGTEFKQVEGNAPAATSFTLRNYGLEQSLADEIGDDSQLPYDEAQDITENLLDLVLLARERRYVRYFSDNTRWTTVNVGATDIRWDAPNSKALLHLDLMRERLEIAAQNATGGLGLILGRPAGYALCRNENFINGLSITRDKMGQLEWPLVQEKLAFHLGLKPENIIWWKTLKNGAARGLAQSNTGVAGDFVWMGNMNQAQATTARGGVRVKPVAGFVAVKKPSGLLGVPAADAPEIYVSLYRKESSKKTVIRVEHDECLVPLRNAAGQLLEDVAT